MNKTRLTLALALCPVVLLAAAPTTPSPGLRACMGVSEPLSRLACYDRELGLVATPAAATVAPRTSPPPPATTVATPPPAAAAPPMRLGEEQLPSRARAAAAAKPAAVSARVTALKLVQPGLYLVTLDDGAQWRQEETQVGFEPAVGDTISIEAGALGSYHLTLAGKGWKRSVRATRVR